MKTNRHTLAELELLEKMAEARQGLYDHREEFNGMIDEDAEPTEDFLDELVYDVKAYFKLKEEHPELHKEFLELSDEDIDKLYAGELI